MNTESAGRPDAYASLESLTREYSRYSRSAGGLSAIAGGSLGLLTFVLGNLASPSVGLTVAMLAAPVLWLALRRTLAQRFYQRLGEVTERPSAPERAVQRRLTAGVALVCAIVLAGMVVRDGNPALWTGPTIAFAALVAGMPIAAWRWLHTPLDLVVGTLLVSQAALSIDGRAHAWTGSAGVLAVGAALMVARGVADHRRFRALESELRHARARALGA